MGVRRGDRYHRNSIPYEFSIHTNLLSNQVTKLPNRSAKRSSDHTALLRQMPGSFQVGKDRSFYAYRSEDTCT